MRECDRVCFRILHTKSVRDTEHVSTYVCDRESYLYSPILQCSQVVEER